MALTDKLTAVADAIRNKTGKTDLLTLDEMPTEIAAIETGGASGIHNHVINTYTFTFEGTSSGFTAEGTKSLDLTQFGVKEDLSNLVAVIFNCNCVYWSYHIQSGVDKSRYSYRSKTYWKMIVEDGQLVLKSNVYSVDTDYSSIYFANKEVNDVRLYYKDDPYSSRSPVYFTKAYIIVEEET